MSREPIEKIRRSLDSIQDNKYFATLKDVTRHFEGVLYKS